MTNRQKTLDMTEGTIWRTLLAFFLPILLGSLLQQLYTTADAIIVGRLAGKQGLAAIDSVYTLLRLPVNFFTGMATGATILISQLYGAKRREELDRAVHTAVAFSAVGGLILSAAGVLAAPRCLGLMGVPAELREMTLSYMRIYFAGFVISMVYNVGAGILRAIGDSETPFRVLAVSCVVNILLDLLLVGPVGWGVAGAALATVLAQGVSALLVLGALAWPDGPAPLRWKEVRFHGPQLKSILRVGLPVGLQSSLFPIANMTIQACINATGTDNIAAWALCGKLDLLIWLVADSLAAALSTFVAQNYGARQFGRVRQGVRTTLWMTLALVGGISLVLFFGCEHIGLLFIDAADRDILPLMGRLMRFLAPLYFLYVFGETFSGALRGGGETFLPMLLTLLGTCGVRVVWVLLVVPGSREVLPIIASYPLSWLVTGIIFGAYYWHFQKRKF